MKWFRLSSALCYEVLKAKKYTPGPGFIAQRTLGKGLSFSAGRYWHKSGGGRCKQRNLLFKRNLPCASSPPEEFRKSSGFCFTLQAVKLLAVALCTSLLAFGYSGPRCESCPRTASGRIKRSSAARRAFKRLHPCPATGLSTGACPGFVIDHTIPLACGGADKPENMTWESVTEGKAKDRTERRGCRYWGNGPLFGVSFSG